MMYTGLVSVTFRQLPPEDIIPLVVKARLQGIEWGGDIHVPHGEIKRAGIVYEMTEAAGLKVAAYGSYFRVGCGNEDAGDFKRVLETAVALHAPVIRVWAGNRGSEEADEAWRSKVTDESEKIAAMAAAAGIRVAFEYHGGTLTDTTTSALQLLKDVGHMNIFSYWQPPHGLDVQARIRSLESVKPWLSNIHVFHWNTPQDRRPLQEGAADWEQYLKIAAAVEGDRFAMLEFVKDNEPQQFLKDAQVLKAIVKTI